MSLNRFEFIGRIGEIVVKTGENSRLEISLAVDAGYMDDDKGEWVERTDWMRLQSWNPKTIDRVSTKYRKGDLVYTEGRVKPWSKGEGEAAQYGYNFDIQAFRLLSRPEKNKSKDGDDS